MTTKKRWIWFAGFMLLVLMGIGCVAHLSLRSSMKTGESVHLYVRSGSSPEAVLDSFIRKAEVERPWLLKALAHVGLKQAEVRVGHYEIKPGLSDVNVIRMLRAGLQTPVRVTFNNVRTVEQLAGKLGSQLLVDSLEWIDYFQDSSLIASSGFDRNTFMTVFIPDTYEMWWNTSTERAFGVLRQAYERFWTEDFKQRAQALRMRPVEVSVLASIVEEETNKADEMPRVAGLYINRLRMGMPLQADPTVKFALGDPGLRRILTEHTRIQSPYNTYLFAGLPPGPIRIPSKQALRAVLNFERHSYLYMCARADFSGYHAFATTLSQHNRNAQAYHKALNERGIMK